MKKLLFSVLWVGQVLLANGNEVDAGLYVPPAATHVIGDELPLVWVFTNQTAHPMVFMWEVDGTAIGKRNGLGRFID